MFPPPPRTARWTVRLGFRTGLAVGIVLVSAIRGCASDVAQIARALTDAPQGQMASTSARPVVDETPSPPAVPTADVEALPRAAVRVEDLPRSRTR